MLNVETHGIMCRTRLALYRLYIGIADGMSVARVWACRYSKIAASEGRSFWVPARPYPRNGHAAGDAEIEPI